MRPGIHNALVLSAARSALLSLTAAGVLFGSGGAARADERTTAQLTYARDAGALRCPDEDELRDSVSARLGYVPFVASGQLVIDARIDSTRAGLRARVSVRDELGRAVGDRTITSATRDCDELARALALAISVAIDPMVLLGPPPEPPPEPPVEPPVVAPDPPAEPIAEPPLSPPVVSVAPAVPVVPRVDDPSSRPGEVAQARRATRIGAVLGVAGGVVPSVRPFVELAVEHELLADRLALRVALRWDAPAAQTSAGGTVRSERLDVRVVLCAGVPWISVCPGLAAGAVFGRGSDVSPARRGVGWTASAVLDAASRFALGDALALEVRVGVDISLRPVSLELNGTSAYTNARVSPHVGVGGMWRIP